MVWTVIPVGGSNEWEHVYTEVDWKRFKHFMVSTSIAHNFRLLAALVLGKYQLTHNVS